ncbi:hypothetical protein CD932_03255 [Janthinobacterium sp. PC23-8]|nr:hypothetical protein CD932_03255 [Janthinobacterium sp. PC23-8]
MQNFTTHLGPLLRRPFGNFHSYTGGTGNGKLDGLDATCNAGKCGRNGAGHFRTEGGQFWPQCTIKFFKKSSFINAGGDIDFDAAPAISTHLLHDSTPDGSFSDAPWSKQQNIVIRQNVSQTHDFKFATKKITALHWRSSDVIHDQTFRNAL